MSVYPAKICAKLNVELGEATLTLLYSGEGIFTLVDVGRFPL